MDQKYPTLTAMGVVNPNQIVRYSIQISGNDDVLRIVYKKREPGSLLPSSKKFKFNRSSRTRGQDVGDHKEYVNVSEISGTLNKAMLELDQIVKVKQTTEEQLEIIQDEILRLEEEMLTRITYLKSLVKKVRA